MKKRRDAVDASPVGCQLGGPSARRGRARRARGRVEHAHGQRQTKTMNSVSNLTQTWSSGHADHEDLNRTRGCSQPITAPIQEPAIAMGMPVVVFCMPSLQKPRSRDRHHSRRLSPAGESFRGLAGGSFGARGLLWGPRVASSRRTKYLSQHPPPQCVFQTCFYSNAGTATGLVCSFSPLFLKIPTPGPPPYWSPQP